MITRSTFDAFNLNAAAGGLFHPESTISAFIEHDVKYNAGSHQKKAQALADPIGPEVRELPNLSSRSSASSLRLLHTRGSSRSSSASSFVSSGSSSRESTATRSDPDLLMLAPRRLDAVPSSADRSSHDFFEGNGDESDHEELEAPNPADDRGDVLDLASKFAALKQIFHTNHAIAIASGRSNNFEAQGENERESGSKPVDEKPHAAGNSKQDPSRRASGKGTLSAKKTSASSMAGSEQTKVSTVLRRESKAEPKKTSMMHRDLAKPSDVDATDKPEKKSKKKEGKDHSGMSLTDLKEEHRAALELLKELGGSADTEFRDDDMDRSIRALAVRSGKANVFGMHGTTTSVGIAVGRTTHSTGMKAVGKNSLTIRLASKGMPDELSSSELSPKCVGDELSSPNRPLSSSSSSSASLVLKLRSSVALGREILPDEDVMGEIPSGENNTASTNTYRTSDLLRNQESKMYAPTSDLVEHVEAEEASAVEAPWRQYCATFDDMDNDEEDDGVLESEDEGTSEDRLREVVASRPSPMTARSTDNRYSEEGFEADW